LEERNPSLKIGESPRETRPQILFRESKRGAKPQILSRESKRDKVPLLKPFPLPYQGRGIKGESYLINN